MYLSVYLNQYKDELDPYNNSVFRVITEVICVLPKLSCYLLMIISKRWRACIGSLNLWDSIGLFSEVGYK